MHLYLLDSTQLSENLSRFYNDRISNDITYVCTSHIDHRADTFDRILVTLALYEVDVSYPCLR